MIAAIVPAAGQSTRMGQPKPLMSLDGETLIHRVVTALHRGGAKRVVVIVPPADTPEGLPVADEARRAGAEVIVPAVRPPEMRASVELGLARLDSDVPPQLVLLAPADAPGISADLVARVVETARDRPGSIVVPSHEGRRGHPLVLPWSLAVQIPTLPVGVGVNALVARHLDALVTMASASADVLADIDTPADWNRWRLRPHDGDPMKPSCVLGHLDQSPRSSTKMQVSVRLFALAKERVGRPELRIELAEPATVADLRAALRAQWPEIAPLWSSALIAVDAEYAADDATIAPKSQIAVIPPVSGGNGLEGFTIND
jgi:molybdenum cofactor cytidylyltransferase